MDWFYALAIPALGWGWNIERRVTTLEVIKATAEHTQAQVDRLVDHLITKADHNVDLLSENRDPHTRR